MDFKTQAEWNEYYEAEWAAEQAEAESEQIAEFGHVLSAKEILDGLDAMRDAADGAQDEPEQHVHRNAFGKPCCPVCGECYRFTGGTSVIDGYRGEFTYTCDGCGFDMNYGDVEAWKALIAKNQAEAAERRKKGLSY